MQSDGGTGTSSNGDSSSQLPVLANGLQADDPLNIAAAEDIMKRGNVSSLWEAMLLLNLGFISAVGPQKPPEIGLQLIFPNVGLQKNELGSFEAQFNQGVAKVLGSRGGFSPALKSKVESVQTFLEHDTRDFSGPGAVLQALCNDTFKNNVVAVLHFNNPNVATRYSQISFYLMKLLDSIGLPVISWDSEFSAIHAVSTFSFILFDSILFHCILFYGILF